MPVAVYHPAAMHLQRSTTLLLRLRASTRLAAFVLLVFVLKIGAAATCVSHDFADLGIAGTHSAIMQSVADLDDANADFPAVGPVHAAGNCSHSGFQHAATVMTAPHFMVAVPRQALAVRTFSLRSSVPPSPDLRPPIA